ncbi:conserved hypothetical protein [Leptospira interrogans serovar Manilae]|uniref:Uncharacterized protein n=1 Tax=Leptospira interrogans serovar Manilae TaxID=214675 RepID=A0AAQ1P1Q6_LEPIR|nr:conserved hypothetical protein [Leptospira interrogans serovar Manilae]
MLNSTIEFFNNSILELVRKIVIGGSSHISETKITTFFRKIKHGFPYVELTDY